jgi:hypothetical protein
MLTDYVWILQSTVTQVYCSLAFQIRATCGSRKPFINFINEMEKLPLDHI